VNVNLIKVEYDQNKNLLYVFNNDGGRIGVTSAKNALNGYQKGRCFYCFDWISVVSGDENLGQVDHFFPHHLKSHGFKNLDGIWNLVLACKDCNGSSGKSGQIPHEKYLTRLNKRNNYLISSHHPLRETLMDQTGKSEKDRVSYLKNNYQRSLKLLVHKWKPKDELEFEF
tara:strand:+ start:47 stop:556 length:510 start_codon:yes stop_codon:yes gene_type:complete